MKYKTVICSSITCSAILIYMHDASAYAPLTHFTIADNAIFQSTLVDSRTLTSVMQDWGLTTADDQSQLFPNPEQQASIDGIAGQPMDYVEDLIDDGAAFEDLGVRALNHFYDPVRGQPLTINLNSAEIKGLSLLGISYPFSTSPDWALKDPQTDNNSNIYALKDVNDYFYRALTSSSKADRDTDFGYMFDGLGHVLHHIGDMAQPQHVRNDMHCDYFVVCGPLGFYNPSLYEKYARTRSVQGTLPVGGYTLNNPVDFTIARDFWYDDAKKGIAQFTNRNFVSEGTNFTTDSSGYVAAVPAYPSPAPSAITNVSYAAVFSAQGEAVPPQIQQACSAKVNSCQIAMYGTSVDDKENPGSNNTNYYASSFSIFDQDLKTSSRCLDPQDNNGTPPSGCDLFALNDYNFQNDLRYLIPRAVAYSAGLINYFFRGRLAVRYDPSTPGGYIVTNKSTYGINASIEVYYDAVDGKRYEAYESAGDVSLDPYCTGTCNDSARVSFQIPAGDPAPVNPGEYMFVMNGIIGSESGIAAKLFEPNHDVYVGQNIQTSGQNEYPTAQQPNFVAEREPDGTLVQDYAIAKGNFNAPIYIGVYNRTLYVSPGYDGLSNGEALGTVRAYSYPGYSSSSSQILTSESDGPTFSSGFAINDNYIFVPAILGPTDYEIRVLDHAGNWVRNLPESDEVTGLSANDKHICALVGGESELIDMQGQVVASLVPYPYNDYFDNMICGSTSDRHYVLSQYSDANENTYDTVYVFDDNGSPVTSFTIDGTLHDGVGIQIAATADKVYISFIQSNEYMSGVAVFNRIVTGNTETYQRTTDIGDGQWTSYGGVAVDMATVLNDPQ